MVKAPIISEVQRLKKVAKILREHLAPFGHENEIDETKLQIRDSFIVENTGNQQKISRAVLETMFPKETGSFELYHYTSLQNLHSITSSQELRLYALRKRLGEGELDTFAEAHGMKGYLDKYKGAPFIEELSNNLFYISMTRTPPKNSSNMWGAFAKNTGVCLKFRIETKAAELRSIQYEHVSKKTLLNEINKALKHEGQPTFLPWTISQIGAFYLPSKFQTEEEVRLLIKRHNHGANLIKSDGNFDYWPVPIGKNNQICTVDIERIYPAPNANQTDIKAAIRGTAFAGVPITSL